MLIFWSSFSWFFIVSGFFVYFWMSKSIFFIWLVLEVMTWSIFYFFSYSWSKSTQQNLFTFFLIQSLASIFWLFSQYLINYFFFLEEGVSFFTFLLFCFSSVSMLFKMGFFPGHIWMWQIYNTGQLWPITMMSTFHKVIPLMILLSMSHFFPYFSFLIFLSLFFSLFLVINNISMYSSFFSFIFLSSLLNYSFVFYFMILEEYLASSIYFFSYWIFFSLIFYLIFSLKFISFNPIDVNLSISSIFLLLLLLFLGGFPPSPLFFFKALVFNKLQLSFLSIGMILLMITSFSYIFFIFFSVFKKILTTQEMFLKEGWFLFFLEDFYFFLSIFIFSWGFLFFLF